jgi:transcriptional regulator with XRE-family HTH domain
MSEVVQRRVQDGVALLTLNRPDRLNAWTVEELGVRVNIDPTYVSRVEGGRTNLRWATLQRFLRALDATLADLAAEIERQADR